jgi:hypothetical protein
VTLEELVEFLGRTGCQVRIQPVLDPTEIAPIDSYEVPQRLGRRSESGRSPMSSPSGPVSARRWIWTTPSGMCQWTTADRRVRRGWATLARWPALVTVQSPTAVGRSASLSPDTSRTARPTGSSTWSPTQGTLALGRTDFSAAVWKASAPRNEISEARRHLPPDVLQISVRISQPLEPLVGRGI